MGTRCNTLYDGQMRPWRSGVITTATIKDSIIAQAARSTAYPTLAGTYTITSETYFDDYSWISGGAPNSTLVTTYINSTNFNTSYNTFPDYAQPLTTSSRLRGMVTGSKRIILNTSTYLYSVPLYDDHGRVIQLKETNYTGGTDVLSQQYTFIGRTLRTHLYQQKSGANAQTHTLLTKYTYDHIGRVKTITKNIDALGDKTVATNTYNELGQLQAKVLGSGIDSMNYSYNIRGWLTGINKNYVDAATSTKNYFGEDLFYNFGFTNTQLNGSIAGVKWKAGGDTTARAYGFSYDNANRLTKADFSQNLQGTSSWINSSVDYTVSNLTYDGGSNILTMRQRGLEIGSSVTVDSLSYSYFANSNQLQKVGDAITDASPLGDFKDTSYAADDYTYDVNGNIIKDYNRHMHTKTNGNGAVYNLLDKPDSMVIANKATLYYTYDAAGATLLKKVNDYSTGATVVKSYQYINGFVYLNDTLQYVQQEEGRIRWAKKRSNSDGSIYYAFEYDYYLKDHLNNVRSVITEGKDTATYAATMETADSAVVQQLFSNVYDPVRTVAPKPAAFDGNNSNDYVSKLTGNSGGRIGPSIVLKVMAGDKVQINTWAYFAGTTQTPVSDNTLLTDLLSTLISGVTNQSGGKIGAGNATALSNALNPNVLYFMSNRTYSSSLPKAYLNWVLLDDQFKYVAGSSGAKQVIAGSSAQALVAPLQTIAKNGYLYVYVSNQSPQDVYFDNLIVTHYTGPLLQEQSYYPFGLQMAGISDKAINKLTSQNKFNGGVELEEDYGVNLYKTFYREYDPQIGRFGGVDSKTEDEKSFNPYHFASNNPISLNDPFGSKDNLPQKDFSGFWNNVFDLLDNMDDNSMYSFSRGESGGGGGGGVGISVSFVDFNKEPEGGAWDVKDKWTEDFLKKYQDFIVGTYNNYKSSGVNFENSNENASVLIVNAGVNAWNDVGHTAIQIGDKVYGYYPTGSIISSPGKMEVESRDVFNKYYGDDGFTVFSLSISNEQESSLQNILSNYISNPGTYSIFGNQCTSVACGSLVAAGVNIQNYYHNHGDPGPAPVNIWLLTPGEFGNILNNTVNNGIVTGSKYYKSP